MLESGIADMAEEVQPVQLKPETLQAFEAYIREAEAAMEQTLHGRAFLWSDGDPKRAKQVRQGKIVAELWHGKARSRWRPASFTTGSAPPSFPVQPSRACWPHSGLRQS